MSPHARTRPLVGGLAGFAVALSGLAVVSTAAPAQADVSTKISAYPYSQPWSDAGLITTNDDWSGVQGVQGYLGDDASSSTTGIDPQTITTEGTSTTDVIANGASSSTSGGVLEAATEQTIALQGSGTADAPSVVFHLDLTGQTGATFSFDAKDIDATADDAIQPIAVQYRVGGSGAFTNLPDGFIADATTGPSLATQVTHRDIVLPAATDGEESVFVRVLTANAANSDEWVGIDDISITTGAERPLSVTQPSDVTATVDSPISDITLAATGGTPPYSWEVTGLPAGLSETTDGVIGGTPTEEGTFPVTATVTDSADPVADDEATFTITVDLPLASIPIAEIQGDGDVSPLLGDPVITEGVVTAAYPSGGFYGFYLQTEGTGGSVDPAARTTSDGVFVRQTQSAGDVTVAQGDFVQVTGTVTEYAGQTQVEVDDAADIVAATGSADPVTPVDATSWPDTDAEKEALEGMLFSPEGDFTVSNTYNTNTYGEVGLAVGTTPLIQPTEVADAQDSAAIDSVEADNAARAIVLDDASTSDYTSSANSDLTPPYISNDEPVRVDAAATFTDDVILTEGGSTSAPTYRFQPLETVVGPASAESPATFENTRTPAPDAAAIDPEGTADLKIASFNVLNYFTTLGDANDDNVGDGGCTAYNDRDGDGNNVNSGCDQRGAWDPQDLGRQQEKIVAAINALDADVVGLMEIENSAKLGEPADEATEALVEALNADAGAGTWAANPSSADLPSVADQDVITNAIIYRVASVDRVGDARALGHLSGGTDAFNNAREPIAQAFVADGDDDPFLVVVNHFKSKSSGTDDGTGQGSANPDRVAQAEALRDWVPTVETDLGVDATFLLGDFNAYTMEDPMQVFYAAGYSDLAPDDKYSYSYSGLAGSLDHVIADPEASAMVTGSDIWNINSGESVALEYSRWNYNATDFHDPGPYRSSDHDPVVVGIDLPDALIETTVSATAGAASYGTDWDAEVTVAPDTATGDVEILDGTTSLETATLSQGSATVSIDGTALQPGQHTLTVKYEGDDTHQPSEDTFDVEIAKAASTTQVAVQPMVAEAGKDRVTLTAAVTAAGVDPTGQVVFAVNGVELEAVQLVDGVATLTGGPVNAVGSFAVTATYLGDDLVADSTSEAATLKVVKATPKLNVKTKPSKVIVDKTRAKVISVVKVGNKAAAGKVKVKAGGKTYLAKLVNGRAVVKLKEFAKTGKKKVKVVYLGNATTKRAVKTVTIRVVRR